MTQTNLPANLSGIRSNSPHEKPSTKIVATIGPSTWDDDVLREIIHEGMTVARINASFADHDELKRVSRQLRRLSEKVAVMADTQGHKIRVNKLRKPISIESGDLLKIGIRPGDGDIWVDYKNFLSDIKQGVRVLIDDGNIVLSVKDIKREYAECVVRFGGEIKPLKTVNLPDTHLSFPPLTPKDKSDIEFAVTHKFDYISASFVRNIKDVEAIREITEGSDTKVIAKIENSEGIENFSSILREVDGIMVARGDLGVEMPAEQVPVLQKKMIQKCRDVGKPVIVATQMLESMRENAAPTRAEISDVANAVFDGADAVMLSAETSSGKHPVKAVKYMARACRAAEQVCSPEILTARTNSDIETDAIARSVIQLTQELPVQKIVIGSISGKTVASIARHRPKINILALVRSKMLMRQLNLFRNVTPLYVKEDLPSDRDWLVSALTRVGVDNRHLRPEDLVVLVSGSGISGKSENSIIEVAKVFDVCDI